MKDSYSTIEVEVLLNEKLQYMGVFGSIRWSEADSCWHGKILGTKHLITYEGDSFEELKRSFKEVVEFTLDRYS
ncbi:HicB-like antitoxin [Vibrio phage 5P1c]|nr:putative type II toxin-antitoxin system HicB family antitoxin [Vibrio phage 495E54-1]CAH9014743.1 putative type II toxin-antitoxin system HicB family antitoxin [Vibrio phage 496E54-1]